MTRPAPARPAPALSTSIGPTSIGPTSIGPTSIGPTSIGPTPIGPTCMGRGATEHGQRRAVLDTYRRHVNRGMASLLTFVGAPLEVRSAGSQVFDEHGRAYLDCGGFGVFLMGHCHPRVVDAVQRQVGRHPLATHALVEPRLAEAAAALASVAPAGLDTVFFANSGTEAVELGLKVARANDRCRVIAMEGGFHGKTLGSLSVTGRTRYRVPFEPLLPLVEFVPFGDEAALEVALARSAADACVILEPVQAEGGVRLPPDGYLGAVRSLCDRHQALLIADEVQSGLGRLGTWWGCEADQVVPDVLLVGKGLSGGVVPVAAMVTSSALFEPFHLDPLLHSSTFGGNPLAAVAAAATIDVIRDEDLVARSQRLGAELLPRIRAILTAGAGDRVCDVRGRGLLIGIELTAASFAAELMSALLHLGVITSYSLSSHEVIRLTPPAILTGDEVDWLLWALGEAATTVARSRTAAE